MMRISKVFMFTIFILIAASYCGFCDVTDETDVGPVTSEASIITPEVSAAVTPEVKRPSPSELEAYREEKIQYFVDVPEGHWANKAVNDLVRMGLTQGYPDGTFRGNNAITRYETAVFLSKMVHRKRVRNAINEKILQELRSEVYKIRYTVDLYKDEPIRQKPVYGHFSANAKFANLVAANAAYGGVSAPIGPVFDYRLESHYRHIFEGGSYIKLSLDTMDSGFYAPRDLVREMFDFEGGFETQSNWGMKITGGPGTVVHKDPANIFPSEDDTVYIRPKNSIQYYYENDPFDAGLQYKAARVGSSGIASVHNINLYAGYALRNTFMGRVDLGYSMDYYANDLRGTVATLESTVNLYNITIRPNGYNEIGIRIGACTFNDPENNYIGLRYLSKDLWSKDSSMNISINKTGKKFLNAPGDLNQDDVLGTNIFNKLLKNGTYDIGVEIAQKVAEGRSFRVRTGLVVAEDGKYDASDPNSEATIDLNMDFGMFSEAVMTIGYRVYQKPSLPSNATSDILGIGFNYEF